MATTSGFPRGERVPWWAASALGVAHIALLLAVHRVRPENLLADGLVMVVPLVGRRARAFVLAALPLWLTGALFDLQPLWLPLRGPIHTSDLHTLDASLFPAPGASVWPEVFGTHPIPALDLATGFAYATYLVEVFGVAAYLYLAHRERYHRLSWAFFAASAIAMLVYVAYPAAPPWYVMQHGFGPADPAALPSAAGAARFDALTNVGYFASFYARNPNVFGAMPSLHAAYPVLALACTWRLGAAWRVATGAFAALVAFSAVYLGHHYVIDVVAGIVLALGASTAVGLALRARERTTAVRPAEGALS